MKAVFLNTMFSLVCFASFVLAAPHQSISSASPVCIPPGYAPNWVSDCQDHCCQLAKKAGPAAPVVHESSSFLYW
ncbi:MAG: hypothetical protein JO301_09625 [Chitinophagaceae bacterium]|nr:hypothetical protein [Chitinophagaceae bacterium]